MRNEIPSIPILHLILIVLVLFFFVGTSASVSAFSSSYNPVPNAKECKLYLTPGEKIKNADIPVMQNEQVFLYLQVIGVLPSPTDDASFMLTSPSGNISQVKGFLSGGLFRGVTRFTEKGVWSISGKWNSTSDSCETSKTVYIGSDSFQSAMSFDETSRTLKNSFNLAYPRESGQVELILLDEALTENQTLFTISLGSIFATLNLDYDTYLLSEKMYSIRSSFYNNYLIDINATLTVRMTMHVDAQISTSPPVTIRYKPEIMRLETNVTIPAIGIQTSWLNFSLPRMHLSGAGGWFPVRTGAFTMVYTLSSEFEGKSASVMRTVRILPPEIKTGKIILTKSVSAASFTGVTMSVNVPLPFNSLTAVVQITSAGGLSLYSLRKIYLDVPEIEIKEIGRNETHIMFESRATSKNGMVSVSFMNSSDGSNWTNICIDTESSDGWRCAWNITGVPPGEYEVMAVATDAIGITRVARVSVKIYASPDLLQSISFHWWWIGLGALIGAALLGTRRLIVLVNPLLVKESELRNMLMNRNLEMFRQKMIECLSALTERYVLVRLGESMDISTYVQHLQEKGALTRDAETILKLSLMYAFSRKVMTVHDARALYLLYLKYKTYLKMKRKPKAVKQVRMNWN